MVPTSSAQLQAATGGSVAPLEEVREGIWALGVPMPPGQPGLGYNLAYILRDTDRRLHVVDPGWDDEANRRLLGTALTAIGGDVATVTATHFHPDHLGLAPWLREQTGARIQLHSADVAAMSTPPRPAADMLAQWHVPAERHGEILGMRRMASPAIAVDRPLDGEVIRLEMPGWDATAHLTPGHSPGHLSIRLGRERLVMTGDALLPTVFAGVGLGGGYPGNPIGIYFDTLDRLSEWDDHEVLPGHGYRFTGLRERADATRAHHARRTAEVRRALHEDPDDTVWDIARGLTWTHGFDALKGGFLWSALAQTAMHAEYVRQRG